MSGYIYADGAQSVSSGGAQTIAIPSGTATDTVVKAAGGRLCRVLVTATNSNAMLIFDNASGHTGTTIGAVPANAAVGSVYDFQLPAANGITVQGNANNPGVTIGYL